MQIKIENFNYLKFQFKLTLIKSMLNHDPSKNFEDFIFFI